MPRHDVVPIGQIQRRMPEAGRIRIGVKTARAMKSIDTFRFTSIYREHLEQLARNYGGTVKSWDDPKARVKNQFELLTETNTLPVYLPANGLSQHYELWSGGGCVRRCDGVTYEHTEMHGPEAVVLSDPCVCAAKERMECRPYTRISMIIPELPFAGTWRLETKGWNAAAEIPGMFDAVQMLSGRGHMVQAILGLEKRSDVTAGQTRNFVVPTLTIAQSPRQLEAGAARVGAIGAGARAELANPHPNDVVDDEGRMLEASPLDLDDEPVEAEVVSDHEMRLRELLADDASEHHLDPVRFVQAIAAAPGGIEEHGERIHQDIAAGRVTPIGFETNGRIRWRKEEA